MSKTKKHERTQVPAGGFFAFPHKVLDSKAYQSASSAAKALLMDICRQHDGKNNGHLHCACTWLRDREWVSNATIQRAKNELLRCGLLVETRKGGLNAGPSLYAVTWLDIGNFLGLDIKRSGYFPGKWAAMDRLNAPPLRDCCSETEESAAPEIGMVDGAAVLVPGAKTAFSDGVAVPKIGNNECLPSARGRRPPIVGKKGASGIKTTGRRPASETA